MINKMVVVRKIDKKGNISEYTDITLMEDLPDTESGLHTTSIDNIVDAFNDFCKSTEWN